MSAIFGKCHFNNKPVTHDELALMEGKLNHWNADDKNLWMQASIGLGHLMRYNTSESLHEKLPLYKSDSQLSITADARIDNRDELYQLLNIEATTAKAIPDSSIILFLYEKYGVDCVQHLIGDFAFAIWDEKKQQLFCARDHMGIKPFFYFSNNNFFAFASELKGLLVIPEMDKTINEQFLYNQMFRNSEQEVYTTLYQHIHRLSPAHYLLLDVNKKTIQLQQYWDMDAETEIHFANQNDYYEGLRHHFEKAVQCRLRTAFPVAAELSGGMDSSGITGVAAQFLKQEGKSIITISNTIPRHVTNEEKLKESERKWIDAVVDFNKIEKAIYTISQPMEHPFEDIDFMLYVNDGLDTWQQQWQIPIREAAQKEGVRTLLSGFPGDEMVTYRGKYYYLDYLDKKQYLKYFLSKRKFPGFHKLDPLIPYRVRYQLHLLKNKVGWYNKHTHNTLKIFNVPAENITKKGDVSWLNPLVKEQFRSYRHYQKQRFLRYHLPARMESETRYGLYFGFEPRFPMADIRLTQYYLSMPNHIKYEGTLYRTAYRKALYGYLPQEILERDDKRGGMAPYIEQLTDEAAIKAKQELSKKMIDELLKNLEGNTYLKHPIKNGMNLPIFRWLEQHGQMK